MTPTEAMRTRVFSLAAAAIIVGMTVQGMAAADKAMVLPVDPAPLIAETSTGHALFKVEIADEAAERSMGLMFREHLPADQGMLFVFQRTQPATFWMKNTILPLDLIFIGEDGKVKAIKRGEPFSEAVISADVPVRFVLELNAGTAAARGIESGDVMRHPEIESIGGQGGDVPG